MLKSADAPSGRLLETAWTDSDKWRPAFWVVLGCGAVALAMAIFGLPPIDLHSSLHDRGIMDPFCGMTRATRFFARGDLASAWRYNPGSYALALAAGLVVVRWFVGTFTGRWLTVRVLNRRAAAAFALLLFVALEVNQQSNAQLLMGP